MGRLNAVIGQLTLAVSLLLISACGGGSGGFTEISWTEGVFEPEASFKNQCQTPRSGTDLNGNSFPDQAGTVQHENHWLRSWSDNTYLWYSEIPDQNPALFTDPLEYFATLRTDASTPSGNAKDRFHFTYATDEWLQLNQAGVSAGYGAKLAIISASPPRDVRVAYTEPGTTAQANLARGTEILEVDGVDVVNASSQDDVDSINAALFPDNEDETHTFVVRDVGSSTTRSFSMTSAAITATPVQNVATLDTGDGVVGYLTFNTHIQTAEEGLIAAFTELESAGVDDLVLDLRYNGGGLLAIASQLAYMVAGSNNTSGKTFDKLTFNDKHPAVNPVTGRNISPTPFYDETLGFSVSAGQALPSLNLNRVFILSTGGTCSASEAIINGLRGANVEVVLIGSTTCGKPYGFYPTDNCGTTYFTIQFSGQNEMGFGDYADGFSPANTQGTMGEMVTGCAVSDDFDNALGDQNEAMFATALSYRANGSCPTPPASGVARVQARPDSDKASLFDSKIYQRYQLLRQNRF